MPAPADPSSPDTNGAPEQDLLLARRAVGASAVGLLTQLLLAGASVVLPAAGGGPLFAGVQYFAVIGLLVWGAVAVAAVFRRARTLERYEAAAAQRAGTAGQTIFQSEADARPAARRLDRVYRFVLPAVGAVAGLALAGLAVSLFGYVLRVEAAAVENPTAVSAVAGAAAFVGFVVGYYLMGMSRGLRWPTLRAGAVWLLGTVLLYAIAALAAGAVAALDVDLLVGVARLAIPAVLLLVGVEVLFNLVLDLYRPRPSSDADSLVRPAFESRLVQLVVSPGGVVRGLGEALNYQFGFEVTRSWFWRLLSRSAAWLVAFGVGALVLLSSFVVVAPHQRAVVTTFGRLDAEPRGPGLHLKWPWPVGRARVLDVTRQREITVGTHLATPGPHDEDAYIWERQHDGLEPSLYIVAPTGGRDDAPAGEGAVPAMPAGVALAAADMIVNYRVAPEGVTDWVTRYADPAARLRQLADAALARAMSRHDIDAAIGPDREAIAAEVKSALADAAARERLGVQVTFVGVVGVMPPKGAAAEFNDKLASEQQAQTRVAQGRDAADRTLTLAAGSPARARELAAAIREADRGRRGEDPEAAARREAEVERQLRLAGGRAAETLYRARVERWRAENSARADAGLVPALRGAWESAPLVLARRELNRLLGEMLPGRPKTVVLTDSPDVRARLETEAAGGGSLGSLDAVRMTEPGPN